MFLVLLPLLRGRRSSCSETHWCMHIFMLNKRFRVTKFNYFVDDDQDSNGKNRIRTIATEFNKTQLKGFHFKSLFA